MSGETYLQRVARLRRETSVDGWCAYDSKAVRPEAWDAFLTKVAQAKELCGFKSDPFVSVDDAGGLYAAWHWGEGNKLIIERTPHGPYSIEIVRGAAFTHVDWTSSGMLLQTLAVYMQREFGGAINGD